MKSKSIHYIISTIISGISGFFLIAILTKSFDPISFGEYSLVIITVGLLNTVLISWMTQSIIRMYKKEHNTSLMLSTSTLMLLSILFIYIILSSLIYVITDSKAILIAVGILFISESIFLYATSFLRALNNAKLYNMSLSSNWILKIVIVYLYLKYGVENIFSVISVLSLPPLFIGFSIVIYLFSKSYNKFDFFSKQIFKDFFKYGSSLIGLASMQWIMASSDRYILRIYNMDYELGIYSLGYSLSSNIYNVFITFLLLISYPLIIKAYDEGGKVSAESSIKTQYTFYLLIILPVSVGLTFLGKETILLISSEDYLESYWILIITNLGMIIYGTIFYINKCWELTKNTAMIFMNSIYSAMINIVFTIILVPVIGGLGAAIGTLAGYTFFLVIAYSKSKVVMKISLDFVMLKKISTATGIMGLTVLLIKLVLPFTVYSYVIVIFLGIATYLIMLKVLGISYLLKKLLRN